MLVRIMLEFCKGRGDVYSGHPELPTDQCSHFYEEDYVEVRVQLDGGPVQTLARVEPGQTVAVPGTTVSIPFQNFDGEKEFVIQIS